MRRRSIGKLLTGEAHRHSRRLGSARVTQLAEDVCFFAGVFDRETSERVSDDVAVMQVGHGRIAAHVEP